MKKIDEVWQPEKASSPMEMMMEAFRLPQYGIDLRWASLTLLGAVILIFAAISFATDSTQFSDVGSPLRWGSALLLIIALCGSGYFIYAVVHNLERLLFSSLRPVPMSLTSFQQVKNILEGISLASGVPAPKACAIESNCTNAFTVTDGKQVWLFLTTGLLSMLNRAELEAVIAHEYSHILEGDLWRFRVSYKQLWRTALIKLKLQRLRSLALLSLFIAAQAGAAACTVLVFLKNPEAGEMLLGLWMISLLFLAILPQVFLPRARNTKLVPLQKSTADQQKGQEFKADKNAMMWTFNPEALGVAILKAGRKGYCRKLDHLAKISFVPLTKHWRKSIYQPTIDERLSRVAEMGHFRYPGR